MLKKFDIRTSQSSQQTLVNLTKVPLSIWDKYIGHELEYRCTEDMIWEVVNKYGELSEDYLEYLFVFSHITTSNNSCLSIKKHGILDLKQSYLCLDSELRDFLEKHNIYIDLENKILSFNKKLYDINYGPCPRRNTEAYDRWLIGRKFYFDFTVCGFLSTSSRVPYLGDVHLRPEILSDIDRLLGLNLSKEWMLSHECYEVIARVTGDKIVYDGFDEQSTEEIVLDYLTQAYHNAFYYTSEIVLLLKNNVFVPPRDILEINSFEKWL